MDREKGPLPNFHWNDPRGGANVRWSGREPVRRPEPDWEVKSLPMSHWDVRRRPARPWGDGPEDRRMEEEVNEAPERAERPPNEWWRDRSDSSWWKPRKKEEKVKKLNDLCKRPAWMGDEKKVNVWKFPEEDPDSDQWDTRWWEDPLWASRKDTTFAELVQERREGRTLAERPNTSQQEEELEQPAPEPAKLRGATKPLPKEEALENMIAFDPFSQVPGNEAPPTDGLDHITRTWARLPDHSIAWAMTSFKAPTKRVSRKMQELVTLSRQQRWSILSRVGMIPIHEYMFLRG